MSTLRADPSYWMGNKSSSHLPISSIVMKSDRVPMLAYAVLSSFHSINVIRIYPKYARHPVRPSLPSSCQACSAPVRFKLLSRIHVCEQKMVDTNTRTWLRLSICPLDWHLKSSITSHLSQIHAFMPRHQSQMQEKVPSQSSNLDIHEAPLVSSHWEASHHRARKHKLLIGVVPSDSTRIGYKEAVINVLSIACHKWAVFTAYRLTLPLQFRRSRSSRCSA